MTWRVQQILAGCSAGLILIARAHAAPWPDNAATRLEALALLQTLNARSCSATTAATLTLDRWCDSHKIAMPAKIVAERVQGNDKAPTDEVRQLLGVHAPTRCATDTLRLHCGEHVLSEADNWYVRHASRRT